MSKTMKAAVVREFGAPLRIEEVPIPEVAPGMIQVAIQASGVCHTDLHAAEGDWPVKPEPPFILGHEGVGFVSAVGAGVTNVKEGDRVGVPWLYTACGHCIHCLGGWETLCESQLNTGYSVNGGFADYVLADPDYIGHLPDNVGFNEIAPVLCAGVTVYEGLKMTETKPGDALVVSGIGGLGHMAVQYAVAMGLNVVAVDIDDAKLDLAKRLGAKEVVKRAHRQRSRGDSEDTDRRRRARRAGYGGERKSIRAGGRHGWARRNSRIERLAAGRLPAQHLRHGAQRHHRARIDRRHAAGSAGIARFRSRWQSEGDDLHRKAGRHQRDLRADAQRAD